MLIFWLVASCMILIALFIVLRPLILRNPSRQGKRIDSELAVFQNRMAEMKNEVESGVLSESEAAMAEIELKKTLLHETEEAENQVNPSPGSGSRNWWAIGISSVLIPAIAISVYMLLGSPHLVDRVSPHPVNSDISSMHQSTIEEMVDKLAARLEKKPDDPEGWLMLINSYITLDKYQEAVGAAERMYDLYGDQPYVMLRYADVLAVANNGRLDGKPAELIKKALTLEPNNVTGLWLGGMVEDQKGDHAAAIEYWQRLLPLLNDDQDRAEVNQLISRAQGAMGITPQITTPAETQQPETGSTSSKSITVSVSLSPDLADGTDPEDALFVYARAVAGPPMPLAVVRKQVKDLPLQVTLDDSLAMFPQMKLSNFEQVKISARVSKSGNAIPQPGDFIGETAPIENNKASASVSVVIDKKVP